MNVNTLISHALDGLSLGFLFLLTLLFLMTFIEIGFRLGRRVQSKPSKAQHSQVRAIMGATLGLLAFMLAFTFAAAQSHYEVRVAGKVEEARVARNAFLHAESSRGSALLLRGDAVQRGHAGFRHGDLRVESGLPGSGLL